MANEQHRYLKELLAGVGARGDDDLVECLEQTAIGIHVVDSEGSIVWLNPAMCAMLGRSAADCLGRPVAELHVDLSILAKIWERLGAGETVRERDIRLRGAGGVCEVLLSGRAGLDHQGALMGARFCVRVLRATRDFALDRACEAIVENAADALLLLNRDGTVAFWNPGAEKLLGRSGAQIRGRFIGEFMPGYDREIRVALRRVLAGDVVREVEAGVNRGDGNAATVTVTACPVRDIDNSVSAISVVVHDISKLKDIEQALCRSEARFRGVVEAIAQIVWSADAEGAMVEDSPSWRAFTGQTFEQMRGWGWAEAIAPEQRAEVIARWKAEVVAKLPVHREYRLRRADGTCAETEIRAVPMLGPGGAVREWVGVNVDISERRRIEREREALVADLQQATHYQAIFMAVLSHDLRSPLTAILMATGLGLRTCTDARTRSILQQITRSGERMIRMVEQLLDVTRIRAAGGLEIRPTCANLATVCRAIIDEVQQARPGARIALSVRGDTQGTWDVDRLSQLASNLIGNAIQHAEGAPVATVCVDGSDLATVRFVVHNRGVIAPEMRDALFDPFRRATKRSASAAGLGLGLHITQQIVLAHGGSIKVESTPAAGTYFRVELTRHPTPAPLSPPGEGVALPLRPHGAR